MLSHERRALAAFVLLGLTTLVAGCGDNATGPGAASTADREALKSLVTSDPAYAQYFDVGAGYGRSAGVATTPVGLSPIGELTEWHRDLARMTQDVEVHMTGSLATITVTSTVKGELVLTEMVGGALTVHRKPLVDVLRRNVSFEEVGTDETRSSERWRLVSMSHVDVEGAVDGAVPTVGIESVLIERAGSSLLLTDPLAEVVRQDMLLLEAGEEVEVTVHPTGMDVLGFLRHGGRSAGMQQRVQLEPQEDGSLKGRFTVAPGGGTYYLSVDLLTNGSLFESDPGTAPYDSRQWNVAYRVAERANEP